MCGRRFRVAGICSFAEGMKLYVFTSQPLDIARSALSAAATGSEKFMIPVAFFLIKHPKGNILFDTGDNDKVITDPTYWGPSASLLDKGVKADLAIDAQLAKVGVQPSDIKYIILGHMHLDHAGNIGKFPKATIVAQRDEIENAFYPKPLVAMFPAISLICAVGAATWPIPSPQSS
jgi:glyoxylase-like metal-dependent hydrolase (beta-lactamase superfamily II)